VAQDLAYLLTVFGGREFHRWYGVAERSTVHDADTRSRASLLRTRGYFVYYQGRYAEAVRVMREARPVTVECGDRYAEADTLLIDAMGSSAIAAPELAAATAEEAIRLGREVGSLRIRALGGLVRARASLRSGEPARAARQLAGARKLLAQVPTRPDLIEITLIEAWMHLDRGAWSAAIAAAEEYTAAARRLGWRMWEPQGPLVVGRAHLGAGRFEAAADELATAATLARRCDAVGVLDLAVALRTQSKLLDGRQVAGGTNDADDVLLGPVLRESDGLRFLAATAWDQAADAFAAAVAGWRPLGLTVWLARGLALHATALRRGGRGRQAAVALRSGEEILASLRTPMRERARILSPVGP
jgi:hypothetical protein